jgi:hypothetical protein
MVFAYVDPELDVDVSRHMETTGVVEIGISQVRVIEHFGMPPKFCNAAAHCVIQLSQSRLWNMLVSIRVGTSVAVTLGHGNLVCPFGQPHVTGSDCSSTSSPPACAD